MHSHQLTNAADLARSARTLIRRFVAIELHPAVYVSFIAININVLLLTLFWGGLAGHKAPKAKAAADFSRPELAAAYMASKRAAGTAVAKTPQDAVAELAADHGDDGESADKPGEGANKENSNEDRDAVAAEPAVKTKPARKQAHTGSKHHLPEHASARASSSHHGGGMLIPPPPPMVPSYLAGEVPAAASIPSEYQGAASDVPVTTGASDRRSGGHHRRRASYTVESDNFKRVIV
ncbi:MAG TPA: hypothetical protein V6C72_10745, partial [Chroococcales cyanobacterium]